MHQSLSEELLSEMSVVLGLVLCLDISNLCMMMSVVLGLALASDGCLISIEDSLEFHLSLPVFPVLPLPVWGPRCARKAHLFHFLENRKKVANDVAHNSY